jgi:hypothetical protein
MHLLEKQVPHVEPFGMTRQKNMLNYALFDPTSQKRDVGHPVFWWLELNAEARSDPGFFYFLDAAGLDAHAVFDVWHGVAGVGVEIVWGAALEFVALAKFVADDEAEGDGAEADADPTDGAEGGAAAGVGSGGVVCGPGAHGDSIISNFGVRLFLQTQNLHCDGAG